MDVLTSRTVLDYPVYACDFDPQDEGSLVVGGGAGARKSDGNKITVLNASDPNTDLSISTELRLPREEDNITSLAAGPHRNGALLAFAGINSSPDDQKKGLNEHFRVFSASPITKAKKKEEDKKEKDEDEIVQLAKAALFESASDASKPDLDTYQRIVRLSAPFPDGKGGVLPQIGACATGMSKTPQIVIFEVDSTTTTTGAVVPRVCGRLELDRDVTDLDLIQTGVNSYQVAYCTDRDLFVMDMDIGKSVRKAEESESEAGPQMVYSVPLDSRNGQTLRPAFHSIRYLTPDFILASFNLPKRTGVVLTGFRLPGAKERAAAAAPADDKDNNKNTARIAVNVRLPRAVTYTTTLAVRNLAPPATPGAKQGNTQFVVALGDAANTISLYTVELQVDGNVALLAKLYPFKTLQNVHAVHITSMALSHLPLAGEKKDEKATTTQHYIHLASVSVGNTVVVHHIPLKPLPAPSSTATASPSKPRYVVALKSHPPTGTSLYLFVVGLLIFLLVTSQAILEVRGLTPAYTGARDIVPTNWLAPAYVPTGSASFSEVAAAETTAASVPVAETAVTTEVVEESVQAMQATTETTSSSTSSDPSSTAASTAKDEL